MKDPNPITFDWESMKWKGITIAQIKLWEGLFPDVDVPEQLRTEMLVWLEKNKTCKAAHKTAWRRFIVNWLRKEQKKMAFVR